MIVFMYTVCRACLALNHSLESLKAASDRNDVGSILTLNVNKSTR